MKENSLQPIQIKVRYDEILQEITGKNEEIVWINQGMSFILFLSMIFSSYPDIERKYPPGTLGLLLNNRPPEDYAILNDGDEIIFICFQNTI